MNNLQSWHVSTQSAEATERLGGQMGAMLRGGEVIELVSDLGGGKTTFVRGLAKGMGSHDKVSSPTFTISREYQLAVPKSGLEKLVHFDFYRLHEAGIVADELAEFVGSPHAAVVVEWGDIVADVLPEDKITIHVQAKGETTRQLTFTYPESRAYAIPKGDK